MSTLYKKKKKIDTAQRTIKFFENLLRASADGILITDSTHNVIVANKAFCNFFGFNRREMVETNVFYWLDQIDPDWSRLWAEFVERVYHCEVPCDETEFRFVNQSKVVRHFSVKASLVEKVSIEESGVLISIWRDVTRRKRDEDLLKELNETLEQRVSERTSELTKANESLQVEVAKRMQTEEALKRAVAEKDMTINDLRELIKFSILMRDETQERTLIKQAIHVLKKHFNPDIIAVSTLDTQKNLLVMSDITPPMAPDKIYGQEIFLDPSLCYTIRTGKKFVVKDVNKDLVCDCLEYQIDEGGYVCFPMVAGGTTIGTALMIKSEKGFWDSTHKHDLLSAYVGLMAATIHGVRLMETTKRSAVTDSLTGVYNRRFFDEMLAKQMAMANRRNEPLSILIIDLDHFKPFNDTYGHQTGDRVLQEMANIMKSSIRTSDILTRYGGQEFAIIMPTTDMTNAVEKAEDIRRQVESNRFGNIVLGKTVETTISIGIASSPEHGKEPHTLVDAADRALYKAKEGGRNRVETP